MRGFWVKFIVLLICLFMVTGSENAIAGSKVLDFDFESTCGSTVLDSSGLNNNGTLHGGTLVDGIRGKGVYLDGIDDYISVPDASSLDVTTGLTMQAWVRLDPSSYSPGSGGGTLFYKYRYFPRWPVGEGRGYILSVDGQYLTVDLNGYGARTLFNYGTVPWEEWVQITVTYDGNYARIYVSGNEVAKESYTGDIAVNDEELRIGNLFSTYGNFFHFTGVVDEVKLYDYALTAGEVMKSYEDYMKPQAITSLSVAMDSPDSRSIVLNWQAPADFYGSAVAAYDIRYSMSPITESNWILATRARGASPTPGSPSTQEQFKLMWLQSKTRYYVAIKSVDVGGNVSSLSNVDSVKTEKLSQ